MIKLKRVYESPSSEDGLRVLVVRWTPIVGQVTGGFKVWFSSVPRDPSKVSRGTPFLENVSGSRLVSL